jgi:5-formyltetrahydrofolate cyclo-ligase
MTKQERRTECRRLRASIPVEGKKRLDALICRRIATSKELERADTVLLYFPIKSEIDLRPLASYCLRKGKTVGLPVTDTEAGEIRFYPLRPRERMRVGAYGIPEPATTSEPIKPTKRTLCILPGLCFDRLGNRLGYGQGYYDRFLADFPGVTVGAVYDKLLFDRIETEEHDFPVSILVTEREIARPAEGALTAFFRRTKERFSVELRQRAQEAVSAAERPTEDRAKEEKISARVLPPILALSVFLLLVLSKLLEGVLVRRGAEALTVSLLQAFIFLLPTAIYLRIVRRPSFGQMRIRLPKTRHAWFCLCMLVVLITSNLLLSILTGGIEALTESFTLYDTFVSHNDGSFWRTAGVILAYALIPAICEETVFRGLFCAEYEDAGVGVAIIISSLFFAMMHFSFGLFPNCLVSGILLACTMYATRSLVAACILHFLYNLFCLFGQPYLSAFYVYAGSNEIFLFCLGVLLLLFSAFAVGEARKIYHVYARNNLSSDYTKPVNPRDWPRRVFLLLKTPIAAALPLLWIVFSIVW